MGHLSKTPRSSSSEFSSQTSRSALLIFNWPESPNNFTISAWLPRNKPLTLIEFFWIFYLFFSPVHVYTNNERLLSSVEAIGTDKLFILEFHPGVSVTQVDDEAGVRGRPVWVVEFQVDNQALVFLQQVLGGEKRKGPRARLLLLQSVRLH